ncbi:MAG: hypothetical protein M1347_01580 [Chloroflexi bacterium]|nr:hypothetical protein [Chloroflexota bacterium]
MSAFKDSVETLRLTVEKLSHANARFKDKKFVPEVREGDLKWEGNVFSFGLFYDTKHSGATKEQIANWRLPGPSEEVLDAAVQRGLKLRKLLLDSEHKHIPEIRRRARLAYAWSSRVRGSEERQFNVVLHEGAVKSHADAVRSVIAKG